MPTTSTRPSPNRRFPRQRRARACRAERPRLVPDPDRRPAHRAAPHRSPLRHAAEPRPAAGAGRRAPRPDRRLPDDHRPRRPGELLPTSRAVADYLAVGIDPERATSSRTARCPSSTSYAPVPEPHQRRRARRNPTVKDEIAMTGGGRCPGLMLTYPVHQAADILFCRPNRAGRQGPAAPPRADAHDRAPVQQALSPDVPCSPSPRPCSAERRSCSASTAEDGQEPRQLIPLAASADETAASSEPRRPTRNGGSRTTRPPPRSGQPPRDRIAESRATARGDRGRDR